MVPFSVVVGDVLRHRAPEMLLPDRNQPVQAFFSGRPHETFRVGVRIGHGIQRVHPGMPISPLVVPMDEDVPPSARLPEVGTTQVS